MYLKRAYKPARITGWGAPSDMSVKIARLAEQKNIFPLHEIENGTRYILHYKGDRPVEDYLQTQGRFKHLSTEDISTIQRIVTEDWSRLLRKANGVPF